MMNSFRFVQRFRPSVENRIPHLISFIKLTLPLIGEPPLFDSNDNEIECNEASILKLITAAKKEVPNGAPTNFDLFAGKGDPNNVHRYEFCIGTSPGKIFIDFFALQFGGIDSLKFGLDTLKLLIDVSMPFEAFLAENNNEFDLNSKGRQNRIQGFKKPAIIRGLHFLDSDMVRSLGGVSFCHKAPAYLIEDYGGGVIIQLVADNWDSQNLVHKSIQAQSNNYFGL